jgi:hypothetical protein
MESAVATAAPARRLGVGHFLAWMLGCGVVLAIYRAATDFSEVPVDARFRWQLVQLGFGLAYGTAISGLGLFLYWRWRGIGVGPTQPGHWLLVFGGIGLMIDIGLAGAVLATSRWFEARNLSPYVAHQALGWLLAAVIGVPVLIRGNRTLRWKRVGLLLVGCMFVGALAYGLWFAAPLIVIPGVWHWWAAIYVRAAGEVIGLSALVLAEVADRREGLPRDWLHLAGIVAIVALVAVDFAVNVPNFLQ